MRFNLVDRILEYRDERGILAAKTLSLAEDYLADHFPGYPVPPGVLMVETMTQTAAWWVRIREGLRRPVVTLQELSHVTFSSFVTPGDTLLVDLRLVTHDEEAGTASFRCKGRVLSASQGGSSPEFGDLPMACRARLTVRASSVGEIADDLAPELVEATEERLGRELRSTLAHLQRGDSVQSEVAR